MHSEDCIAVTHVDVSGFDFNNCVLEYFVELSGWRMAVLGGVYRFYYCIIDSVGAVIHIIV